MSDLPDFFNIAAEQVTGRRYKIYMPTGSEDVYIVSARNAQEAYEQILEGRHNPVQTLAGEEYVEFGQCYVLRDEGNDHWEEVQYWETDA